MPEHLCDPLHARAEQGPGEVRPCRWRFGVHPRGHPAYEAAGHTRVAIAPSSPASAFSLRRLFVCLRDFCSGKYPYDPELYFLGEEAAMTLRAFTHGYDLFHPCETIVWHDYVRKDGIRHWDDHTEANKTGTAWSEWDLQSKNKIKRLLAGQPVDEFGLGTVRTIEDFEAYAGLSFRFRKVQDYTSRSEEPPNPEVDSDWAQAVYSWLVRITLQAISFLRMTGMTSHSGTSECMTKATTRFTVEIFPSGTGTAFPAAARDCSGLRTAVGKHSRCLDRLAGQPLAGLAEEDHWHISR